MGHDEHTIRERAAENLESVADSIRAVGDDGADRIQHLAKGAGGKLDRTAKSVRDFAGGDVFGSLKASVRRKPLECVAVAGAIGLIAGLLYRGRCRACSSDD